MKEKIDYMKSKGLAGVMFWTISGDLPEDDPDSILSTTQKELSR